MTNTEARELTDAEWAEFALFRAQVRSSSKASGQMLVVESDVELLGRVYSTLSAHAAQAPQLALTDEQLEDIYGWAGYTLDRFKREIRVLLAAHAAAPSQPGEVGAGVQCPRCDKPAAMLFEFEGTRHCGCLHTDGAAPELPFNDQLERETAALIARIRALESASNAGEAVADDSRTAIYEVSQKLHGLAVDLPDAWLRGEFMRIAEQLVNLCQIPSISRAVLASAQTWQPIETAPKDGVFVAYHPTFANHFWVHNASSEQPLSGFTHWMHLAAPNAPDKEQP